MEETVEQAEGNSISDIRRFFTEGARPLEQNEFVRFWQHLSDEDKDEFKHADLSNPGHPH
jgi:hypothetical protein